MAEVPEEVVYGSPGHADGNIIVRCSCAAGCILAFSRWDEDDGPEFYGEFYSGFHPQGLKQRLKAAWTCLRGHEQVASSMVLTEDGARALGRFLEPAASREEDADRG